MMKLFGKFQYSQLSRVVWKSNVPMPNSVIQTGVSVLSVESSGLEATLTLQEWRHPRVSVLSVESSGLEERLGF